MSLLVELGSRLEFYVHLWVEDARWGSDDAHSRVVCLELVNQSFLALDNGHDLKTKVLGVHIRREGIRQALLGARWDLDAILGTCKIAYNCHRRMCSRR